MIDEPDEPAGIVVAVVGLDGQLTVLATIDGSDLAVVVVGEDELLSGYSIAALW